MSNLWKNYSYAIILIILSFLFGLVMIFQLDDKSESYKQIVVSKGQSLWKIADTYKIENGMTQSEFIKWVQNENHLRSENIQQGQTIFIPVKVKNNEKEIQQLASNVK